MKSKESMKPSYNQKNKNFTRESIIGLGESSFRKNYYPELQEKLLDLERTNIRNKALITTIPDLLLVSDLLGHIAPFSSIDKNNMWLINAILGHHSIMVLLRAELESVIQTHEMRTCYFTLEEEHMVMHFEARMHISELDEILIMIRDITEQRTLEMQLRKAAQTDGLTGLYNRLTFENKLLEYHKNTFNKLTVILLDIDGLKLINDTLGHMAGDHLIISMADIIRSHFKDMGFTARIGGDEFGVIIEGKETNVIEQRLEQLNDSVHAHNATADTLKITMSFGYSYHQEGHVDTSYMYQEADNNMYQNKLLKTSSTRHNIVKTLMKALEARDYITEGHADRMEHLAKAISRKLGLNQAMIDRIILLTKFHDIGKVGISDAILNKPDKLTQTEYNIMKTHSAIGERIAKESSELKDIAHLILKHHEKWDGTGYPLGLYGGYIPLECRILSIVDTYDAMTNDRPYRKALSHETAVEEIKRCSANQFDPDLVSVFCAIDFDAI